MATPQVPPRPVRSQRALAPASTTGSIETPIVPPRPTRTNRSRSPHPSSFAPSPLNDNPFPMPSTNQDNYAANSRHQRSLSSGPNPLQRSPSVTLPSIGQEGNEYANMDNAEAVDTSEEPSGSPTHSRNVGNDLPLHAPKPSLSSSNARARVAPVTRTDSSQAAAVGIGKARTPVLGEDKDSQRPVQRKTSSTNFARRGSSASTERPGSIHAEAEQGIPEIGQRVPMYPNAGDVQAPSPAPFAQIHPGGIGFHNDGSHKAKQRAKSGKDSAPPGSYGLHSHGVIPTDRFEKAWYDKHPEALVRDEQGHYGLGLSGSRGEWALSSEDLNKIVRDTASRGAGFGTTPDIVGLPNEQIGYMASEEYASRMHSPKPYPGSTHSKASNHSQPHVDSPLRKSFLLDANDRDDLGYAKTSGASGRRSSEHAVASDNEDDNVIHIDAPDHRTSKVTGNGYDPPKEDLGPRGGNTEHEGGWIDERGYGVPILASDEVAKEPGYEYQQPAVAPDQQRRGNAYYSGIDSDVPLSYQSGYRHGSRSGSANSSRPTSRPGSRPGSIHGGMPGLSRFTSIDDREDMHTPLEDVEEYEPLFPEDDEKTKKAVKVADRFKQRPGKHRFPSQDIWEDTPNSLQLEATVTSPEPEQEEAIDPPKPPSSVFETPEQEAGRKGEVSEREKAELLPKEDRWATSQFKPHVREEIHRPGLKQRFPSQDIWEDTPNSAQLETTVAEPQSAEEAKSPVDLGLEAGAVVNTAWRPNQADMKTDQARDGATAGAPAVAKPIIPARPTKTKHMMNAPATPALTAPTVPTRPVRKVHQVPPAEIPPMPSKLATSTAAREPKPESSTSDLKATSPEELRKVPSLPERAKPQVPARPTRTVHHKQASASAEGEPLTKTISGASIDSTANDTAQNVTSLPPATKPKPTLPSRPVGGKIAALKAGFLSGLEKRLQHGPPAALPKEKTEEEQQKEEEDKAPLQDARKGRARGPARRKPAVIPAPTVSEEPKTFESKAVQTKLSIAQPWGVWQISDESSGRIEIIRAFQEQERETNEAKPEEAKAFDHAKFEREAEIAADAAGPAKILTPWTEKGEESASLTQQPTTQTTSQPGSTAASSVDKAAASPQQAEALTRTEALSEEDKLLEEKLPEPEQAVEMGTMAKSAESSKIEEKVTAPEELAGGKEPMPVEKIVSPITVADQTSPNKEEADVSTTAAGEREEGLSTGEKLFARDQGHPVSHDETLAKANETDGVEREGVQRTDTEDTVVPSGRGVVGGE